MDGTGVGCSEARPGRVKSRLPVHRDKVRTENEVSQNCVQEPDWKLERERKPKATAGQGQSVLWGERNVFFAC